MLVQLPFGRKRKQIMESDPLYLSQIDIDYGFIFWNNYTKANYILKEKALAKIRRYVRNYASSMASFAVMFKTDSAMSAPYSEVLTILSTMSLS